MKPSIEELEQVVAALKTRDTRFYEQLEADGMPLQRLNEILEWLGGKAIGKV